ncbi:calcineurin-like phosphoesterase C-terminal domain-containing protein [Pararcticibacter amylolyticus]|uniref:Serine/threonine protein phosphatase n=1 Tax=Pararcticibacter amylolyticus TaxID=2173175 RepID=A0A2U2PK28_9SPHI|nr:calcineurin-like phosphoesterase family protein [Pararcticibacter amylolyticus]PWG81751.1 serine/threonine protein phosphatase [Pararcticibacter amylolyticus]
MRTKLSRSILLVCTCLISLVFAGEPGGVKPVKGKVICSGRGVPGVVVSDGFDCVKTRDDGSFVISVPPDRRFIQISAPSGYVVPVDQGTIPRFYQEIKPDRDSLYTFYLRKNPKDDSRHVFFAQADVQVTKPSELHLYESLLEDCRQLAGDYKDQDLFGLDCGDIVGDMPELFPGYIKACSKLQYPIYRAIGNHDMTYYGRTHETSEQTFSGYFGPANYSFNKGKAHYIVINDNFFIGRDYFYMGYVDEKTFHWLEQDLAQIPEGSLVFLVMHIPSQPEKEKQAFKYDYTSIADQVVNARALHNLLRSFNTHIISGHMHSNSNLNYTGSLMEHNTAAVCGTWWKADVCIDGTPRGYGVYEVDGDQVQWYYKSFGFDKKHQMRVYPAGSSAEHPSDIIVNVWNYDERWKVEWTEGGKLAGKAEKYTGYDPYASALCADKQKMEYDWISPALTSHLFKIRPGNPGSRIEIIVTDRFGNIYREKADRQK